MTDLDAVLDWVFEEGQHIPDLHPLFAEMMPRIVAAGVPIDRMLMGSTLMHPNYRVQAMSWTAEDGMRPPVRLTFEYIASTAFVDSPMNAVSQTRRPARWSLTDPEVQARFTILAELADAGYVDYLAIPLVARGEPAAIVTFASRTPDGFDAQGPGLIRLMRAVTPVLALIRAEQIAHDLMSTYVGPATGPRVLAGQVRPGDADPIDAVLWLCDLRDFTVLTRQLGAQAMLPVINAFFETMAAPLSAFGGEVLKFVGDAMLAIFPSEGTEGPGSAAGRAVTAARHALDGLATLSAEREARGEPALRTGIALHFGRVLYGNIGTSERLDFTVIGEAVNTLARVETLCRRLDTSLLMTEEVATRVGRTVNSLGHHALKGLAAPIEVFALADDALTVV